MVLVVYSKYIITFLPINECKVLFEYLPEHLSIFAERIYKESFKYL